MLSPTPPVAMEVSAPATPTQAYTSELTKRVDGLVREEKKTARRLAPRSRPLISSKCVCTGCSIPKARTTFCWVSISSINEVCSPRIFVCRENILYVFLAMKEAATSERGVMTTTAVAMIQLTEYIKPSVPRMVKMPVKSWVKPISRPSAN